jgi:hypothetical protein
MCKGVRFQAFEHEADHGGPQEGGDGSCVAFEIARQSSIAADPGEGPLESLRQDRETMEIAGPDDLDRQASRGGDRRGHFRPLISGVGKDAFDEGKAPPRLPQQIARPVSPC